MSAAFVWHMPVDLRFGAGCSEQLAAELDDRRAVVLAFEPAGALGIKAHWRDALGSRVLAWEDVGDGLCSVERARALAPRLWPLLEAHADAVLVAVGGGTTLDLAKLLRCRPRDGDFGDLAAALRGTAGWPAISPAPLWLLPTTAGTGSEVTRWATFWDTDTQPAVKRSFDEAWGYADRAFVDPALTMSCPRSVTRDTALDTLAHALESLWNRHANPVSSGLAVSAARRVLEHLPACLLDPGDLSLRSELSLAALEAGLAFSQTRTALAHALSYAVTLEQGVPHGLACAIWLPTAWDLAVGRDDTVDRRLGEVFAQAAGRGSSSLSRWLEGIGVDARPEAFGISDGPERIAAALRSARGRNFVGGP